MNRRLAFLVATLTLVLGVVTASCGGASPTATTMPTYTPAPTYTPLPTYTSIPTPTLRPGEPTYTPRPTYTPLPTYTSAPTATPAPPQILKIGVSAPITGPSGTIAMACLRGYEMLTSEINSAGGFAVGSDRYVIKLVVYDDKYSASEGVTVANKLIFEDKVKFVMGPIGSAPAIGAKALYDENKVFRLNGASNPQGHSPYGFPIYPTPELYYPTLWKHWEELIPGSTQRIAMLNPNNATGQVFKAMGEKTSKIMGVNVVASVLYEPNIADFTPVLASLLASSPTAIDISFTMQGHLGMVVQRLRELGYAGPIGTVQMLTPQDLLTVTTAKFVEGFVALGAAFNSPNATPEQRSFYERYIREYGEPVWPLTPEHYVGLQIMIKGIQSANSLDPTKVRDAVINLKFDSLMGPLEFIPEPAAPGAYMGMVPRHFSRFTEGKLVPWFIETVDELKSWAKVMWQ